MGEYLRHHAYRAYGAAKIPPEVEGAQSIASLIRSEGLKTLKARDIYNRRRSGLTKSQQVKAALSVLIEADWLREIRAATGGSPSVDYAVNPKLEVGK
ncbi:hypothetical protein [Ruegeria sp. HKCCA6707]|uniref:hypothetical protein n=1 Tax=Ruegeria sp. HKCCA6707 TaxID=2682996 RepID=UPI0014898788|nr:hypothetical protein [Ruegeria sp. HKCCA6707]